MIGKKSCPICGHRISLAEYLRLTSLRFRCAECGAPLGADRRHALATALVTALPMGFTVHLAMDVPGCWVGVVAVMGLGSLCHYALFRVVLIHEA